MASEVKNIVQNKSFAFAGRIIQFCIFLKKQNQYEIAAQLLRSGTSIGANVREAQRAESKKDFIHKLRISLKEADETKYWLELINENIVKIELSLLEEVEELIKILVSIINSTNRNLNS